VKYFRDENISQFEQAVNTPTKVTYAKLSVGNKVLGETLGWLEDSVDEMLNSVEKPVAGKSES
jgi:hypothetical protein